MGPYKVSNRTLFTAACVCCVGILAALENDDSADFDFA